MPAAVRTPVQICVAITAAAPYCPLFAGSGDPVDEPEFKFLLVGFIAHAVVSAFEDQQVFGIAASVMDFTGVCHGHCLVGLAVGDQDAVDGTEYGCDVELKGVGKQG